MSDETEYFVVGESVSDLPKRKKRTNQDIEKDLFGQERINKMIDAFETQNGFRRKEVKPPKLLKKNIVLTMTDEDDANLFNELLNDPELYTIIKMSETWTQRGDPKVWIVYAENLDVRKEREFKKKVEEEQNNE